MRVCVYVVRCQHYKVLTLLVSHPGTAALEEKEILDRSSAAVTTGTKLDRRIDIQPAEDEDGKGECVLMSVCFSLIFFYFSFFFSLFSLSLSLIFIVLLIYIYQ